jgi:hypothetical protein
MAAPKEEGISFATLEPHAVIVVHDAKTGTVLHVHQELTLSGAIAPRPEKLTMRATAFARDIAGQASTQLKTMYVEPAAYGKLRGAFTVDPKTGTLIERKARGDALKKKSSPIASQKKSKPTKRGR